MAPKVRVIGADGSQVGVIDKSKAIEMARSQSLDLLLISDQADTPVCKIIDIGQYRYIQQKKEKQAKKNTKNHVIKELKLSPKISVHDYNVRLTSGIKFLKKGYNIKVSVFFKGRERTHPELGEDLLNRFKDDIKEYGEVSTGLTKAPRILYLVINPK